MVVTACQRQRHLQMSTTLRPRSLGARRMCTCFGVSIGTVSAAAWLHPTSATSAPSSGPEGACGTTRGRSEVRGDAFGQIPAHARLYPRRCADTQYARQGAVQAAGELGGGEPVETARGPREFAAGDWLY